MKKTSVRILSLALAFATAFGGFVACSRDDVELLGKGEAAFADVYRAPTSSCFGGYTEQKTLSIPADAEEVGGNFGFLRYKNSFEGKYVVYSVDSDGTVCEIDESKIASTADISFYDGFVRVVTTEGTKKTSAIYTEKGVKVATAEGEKQLSVREDACLFDGKLYHVKDGEVKKTYTVAPFFRLDDTVTLTDGYLVRISERCVTYYDESFTAIAIYEVPGDAIDLDFSLLEDGKLFVSYLVPCDETASDYDFHISYSGYTLSKVKSYCEILDPATGKSRRVDLDGACVYGLGSRYEEMSGSYEFYDIFTDNVKNILAYYAVKDGFIDRTMVHYVLMDNEGKIGAPIDAFVEGQRGLILPVNDSLYSVKTVSGYALLDATGNIKETVTLHPTAKDYGFLEREYTTGATVYRVYDKSLQLALVVDGTSTTLADYYAADNEGVLLYKKTVDGETVYYAYGRAGEKKLEPATEGGTITAVSAEHGFVWVKSTEGSGSTGEAFTYEGRQLFYAMGADATVYGAGDHATVVRYVNLHGDTVYLRLWK